MGAVVGYLLASALPLPWLAVAATALLALNLLSERVSFSAIVDSVAPLRAVDRLGRRQPEVKAGGAAEKGERTR